MFYEEDLQSGIALAIQEGKSVVCFVKDDSDESTRWEQEWLRDANVPFALARRAVTLRLEAGSQEAGFLTAFCTITNTPTLVIIRQGKLEDQINSGTGKNDFTLRLMRAINPDIRRPQTSSTTLSSTSASTAPPNASPSSEPASTSSQPITTAPTPSSPSPSVTPNNLSASRDPNRDKRRKPPDPEPVTSSLPPRQPRANENYAKEQVQRKQEAQAERDRVRRLVEADKLERRRAREEQERRRRLVAQEEEEAHDPASQTENITATPRASPGTSCNLQVRFVDGSSLRQRFGPSDTIAVHVRPWIDASRRDSQVPYTLKLLRTPQPSKHLTDSDELLTLQELGVVPSATLLLVPVRTFSGAYKAGGADGFMRGLPALIWGYAISIISWIFGLLMSFLNVGVTAMRGNIAHQERRDAGEIRPAPSRERKGQATGSSQESQGKEKEARKRDTRIRTLRDQTDGQDDRQFYNGNQLNFEPNKDDASE